MCVLVSVRQQVLRNWLLLLVLVCRLRDPARVLPLQSCSLRLRSSAHGVGSCVFCVSGVFLRLCVCVCASLCTCVRMCVHACVYVPPNNQIYVVEPHPVHPYVVATGGFNGAVAFWDVRQGVQLRTFHIKSPGGSRRFREIEVRRPGRQPSNVQARLLVTVLVRLRLCVCVRVCVCTAVCVWQCGCAWVDQYFRACVSYVRAFCALSPLWSRSLVCQAVVVSESF
jgi:hypothetical protein